MLRTILRHLVRKVEFEKEYEIRTVGGQRSDPPKLDKRTRHRQGGSANYYARDR
jgi:hypothetical protein